MPGYWTCTDITIVEATTVSTVVVSYIGSQTFQHISAHHTTVVWEIFIQVFLWQPEASKSFGTNIFPEKKFCTRNFPKLRYTFLTFFVPQFGLCQACVNVVAYNLHTTTNIVTMPTLTNFHSVLTCMHICSWDHRLL